MPTEMLIELTYIVIEHVRVNFIFYFIVASILVGVGMVKKSRR